MASQGQGVSLNAFIAHKLKRGNEAEVELGQLASQQAESESVKQFAQMMVKAHTEMIQKLDQLDLGSDDNAAGQPNASRTQGTNQPAQPSTVAPGTVAPGTSSNSDLEQRRGDNTRNSESNTTGERTGSRTQSGVGGSQASSQTGSAPGATTPAGTQVNPAPGQPHMAGGMAGGMSGHVPHMLVAITDQACDNELQMTKDMLNKHKGDDFEMAYIGQQIVAHTCMLAHLQALKTSGPPQLQQLVSEGERTTREHLDHAMKIAKDLGGESSDSNQKSKKRDSN